MRERMAQRDQFSVRIPRTLRDELDRLADRKATPRNTLIVQLLELGLKQQRKIDQIVEAVA